MTLHACIAVVPAASASEQRRSYATVCAGKQQPDLPAPIAVAAAVIATVIPPLSPASSSASTRCAAEDEWILLSSTPSHSDDADEEDECKFDALSVVENDCTLDGEYDAEDAYLSYFNEDRADELGHEFDSFYHAVSARHSRRSRRQVSHSRVNANAMQRARGQPHILAAMCHKSAPTHVREKAHSAPCEQHAARRASLQAAVQLASKRALAAAAPSASAGMPVAPAAHTVTQRKGEARAAVSAGRRLPAHLHSCSSPRWRAVLEQRAVTKQRVAQTKAQGPRQCAVLPAPRVVRGHVRVLRAHGPKAAQKRDAQVRQQQQLLRSFAAQSTVPPVSAFILAQRAAAFWAETHSATRKPKHPRHRRVHVAPSSPKKTASIPMRHPVPLKLKFSKPLQPWPTVADSTSFAQFRQFWFQRNRSFIAGCLQNRSILGLRPTNLSRHVQNSFLARRTELNEANPTVTFHGTASGNFDSICSNGFLLPGRRTREGKIISVAHGSSYGKGIYSSMTAEYSTSFASHTSGTILVCALLTSTDPQASSSPQLNRCGSICVSFDERRIIPVFFLDFSPQRSLASSSPEALPVSFTSAHTTSHQRAVAQQARADRIRDEQRQAAWMPPHKTLLRIMLRALHKQSAREALRCKLERMV